MLRIGLRLDGTKGFLFILILLAGLFGSLEAGTQPATNREMTISAAISLKNAFEEIGKLYGLQNPGVKLVFNFGASGDLARQIEAGAPVDVFAPAAQKDMDDISRKGLLAVNSRRDFTGNTMVLVKPAQSTIKLSSLKDLQTGGVKRIAIGNPKTVPAGRYAEEILKHFNLWDVLKEKIIFAENARQVLDYVAREEVDAGLVYSTDATVRIKEVKIEVKVAEGSHQPILYPIAVLKGAKDEEGGWRFVEFVLSAEAQRILKRHGFTPLSQ
jgi:molybdate transport system substrate-binding protein